jgi:hypothetical protein
VTKPKTLANAIRHSKLGLLSGQALAAPLRGQNRDLSNQSLGSRNPNSIKILLTILVYVDSKEFVTAELAIPIWSRDGLRIAGYFGLRLERPQGIVE